MKMILSKHWYEVLTFITDNLDKKTFVVANTIPSLLQLYNVFTALMPGRNVRMLTATTDKDIRYSILEEDNNDLILASVQYLYLGIRINAPSAVLTSTDVQNHEIAIQLSGRVRAGNCTLIPYIDRTGQVHMWNELALGDYLSAVPSHKDH